MEILGKIENVDIRKIWHDEARDFTPWLATPEGLAQLGEELGEELELIGVEKKAGSYKADIVAKIVSQDDDNHIVVIENQLDTTDHDHLGKLITYASGHNAVTCVWIAYSYKEEHRQAIDWLNQHMTEVTFFAFEIEVIKIGNSSPAMRFKQISVPNQWSRAVRDTTTKVASEKELGQLGFWQELKVLVRVKKEIT